MRPPDATAVVDATGPGPFTTDMGEGSHGRNALYLSAHGAGRVAGPNATDAMMLGGWGCRGCSVIRGGGGWEGLVAMF